MEIYLEVLRSDTLADSLIEKHVVMRLNCHRNLGEVFESLGGFEQAKHYFTQALKIETNDPLSWTRLGFLNYEYFKDLAVAKGCFQAAAHTLPTLERVSAKICPVLVKLAEISFLMAEFEECEKTVDAIINRQPQDKKTLLFSFLMKYYLLSLKSSDRAEIYLKKAEEVQQGARPSQLEVFQRAKARSNKLAIVFNSAQNCYQAIGGVDERKVIKLSVTENREISFQGFLSSLLQSVLAQGDLKQTLQPESTAVFDFSEFARLLDYKFQTYRQVWMKQQSVMPQQDEQMVSGEAQVVQQDKKADKMKQNRKKMDSTDKQVLSINLNRLSTYRDYINQYFGDQSLEFSSVHEIMTFKDLIERGATQNQQIPQNIHSSNRFVSADIRLLDEFRVILSTKMDKHGCGYVVRNLLRYLCRNNSLIGSQEASHLFKLFIQKLDEPSIQACDPEVLIFMFELALFNKEVIKETKSGPIMNLRMQLYEYCDANFTDIMSRLSSDAQKFRLTYTMMFTAFEVKNDMEASVRYFDWLNLKFLLQEGPLCLHWLGNQFQLDYESISVFGQQKIKEAQVINLQNQALKEIKQREYDSTKTVYVRQQCKADMALFYAEQLFLYLSGLIKTQDASHGVNFQSTEDKIKEIWDQLLFCLVRVQPSQDFLKITNHLFSVITAFQFLAKAPGVTSQLYEKVLLKKIDFEPLMNEIAERLRLLATEVIQNHSQQENYQDESLRQLENNQIATQTLFKLLIHLLRIFTAEFVFFNVKIGGSVSNPTDPGQPFLAAFMKSLFYLEFLRSLIAVDGFNGVYILLQQLDSLAQEYQDFFMRPYTRLFISAFPFLLKTSLSDSANQAYSLLVQKSLKYLFNMTALYSDSQFQKDGAEVVEIDEEDCTEFSLFAGMNFKNVEKPKFTIMKPHEVFRAIVIRQKEVDVAVMFDLVRLADKMMNGRLLSHSKLTMQDIINCSKLIETLSKILQDKRSDLGKTQGKVSEQSQFLKYTAFKENPFVAESPQISNQAIPYQGMHTILKAIVNVFCSLGLQVFDSNTQMTFQKRSQLLDRFPSLADLKKLRTLISIDLQFTTDPADSALMFSIVELQNYMQALDTKLLDDYKHADNYINIRQLKLQTVNAAIYSMNQNYLQQNWQECFRAIHQLLKINYVRTLTKRDKSKPKFKNLVATCGFLAYCCEHLEYLILPQRKDPRSKLFPQQTLADACNSVVEVVILVLKDMFQQASSQGQTKTILLTPQSASSCIANISSILAPLQSYFATLSKQSLNADYPFIQAQMNSIGNNSQTSEIQHSKQALETAAAQNDVAIVFESLLLLIDKSLSTAFHLKYSLQQGNQSEVIGMQEQFSQFTKPIMQTADSYLQKFVDKLNSHAPSDGSALEFLVFDRSAVHLLQQKIVPVSLEMNQMDYLISRLYKTGDVAIACLAQLKTDVYAANWLISRYKYMLQNSLAYETGIVASTDSLRLVQEDVVIGLKEMQTGEDQFQSNFESLGQLPIFKQQLLSVYHNQIFNRGHKSLVSMFYCSAVNNGLTEHKINYKLLLLRLSQTIVVYEPAYQLYKKSYEIFKKSITSAADKLMEHPRMFKEAKESLFTTLRQSVQQLADTYLLLRKEYLKFEDSKNRQGYSEAKIAYYDFRKKYELTASNHPQVLKDVLEIFVESHYSKQFLRKNNLVNDVQRATIRQTLIQVCGICGPDHEAEPAAIRMVDLLRINDNDYQWEALKTCIVWYLKFLEENKKAKKDQDLQKKLQATFEEIQQEVLAATSQFGGEIKQRIANSVYQTPSKQPRQELSATKIFSQKKLN